MDILAIQIVRIYCNVDNRICYKKNYVDFFCKKQKLHLKSTSKYFTQKLLVNFTNNYKEFTMS